MKSASQNRSTVVKLTSGAHCGVLVVQFEITLEQLSRRGDGDGRKSEGSLRIYTYNSVMHVVILILCFFSSHT